MKNRIIILILGLTASASFAQNLTPDQKDSDFRFLASLFSTYYSSSDWKKQLFGFDVLNLSPWLNRVKGTATDLDFYELCVEYVASLNDTHASFEMASDFEARLGFTTDLYDGVLLIDSLNRTTLPQSRYPFVIGDELVSVDGIAVEQLLRNFAIYARQGNPLATKRLAAARITNRIQTWMPHAADLGDTATVVIRRQNGDLETYTLPWVKTGTPLQVGPVPSPKLSRQQTVLMETKETDYMAELEKARFSGVLRSEDLGLNGFGSRSPVFLNALPALNFTRRLGGAAADFFYSGTFKFEELTIGYIRIPTYSPPSQAVALQQLEQEIAFMNSSTDGLIVDEMRNTGGRLCFGEEVVRRLIPYKFQATGFALRPFWTRVLGFYNSMVAAKVANASQDVIQQYEQLFKELLAANQQGRLVTNPLPLCSSSLTRGPATDLSGNVIAYRKPLVMLIDEFSTSTADSVAAMIQDARRGLLYGMRTNGAGGTNTGLEAGPFSEGYTGMTLGLMVRPNYIWTSDYPTVNLIENVGVRPDFEDNYMTKDNLLQNGYPFVNLLLFHTAYVIRNQ